MKFEYLEKYKYKVKTPSELVSIIGLFPREITSIMCHGVFDVVHPGHLRHLSYAKTKANFLIVSVTADRHISKGMYRPHVPEDMRALNLAATSGGAKTIPSFSTKSLFQTHVQVCDITHLCVCAYTKF